MGRTPTPALPLPLRRRVRRAAVGVAGVPLGVALLLLLRLTGRRAGVALMYHGVELTGGDPAHTLVPAHGADVFERQVRHLSRHYRLVPAGALQEAARRRRRFGRFPAALTFDDDLACHAAVTMPILRSARAPGTFFLSGASLERPFSFWWERVDRAVASGASELHALVGAPPGNLESLGRFVEELTPEERDAAAERLVAVAGPDPADSGMRAADVRGLADAGLTVGFHTLRHDALTLLSDEGLNRALTDGRAALAQAAGASVDVIGYPHGRADRRVADAARAAGFVAGFTTRRDAVTPASDPLLQGRIGPSLRSVGGMALELALTLARAGNERSSSARVAPASESPPGSPSTSGGERAR